MKEKSRVYRLCRFGICFQIRFERDCIRRITALYRYPAPRPMHRPEYRKALRDRFNKQFAIFLFINTSLAKGLLRFARVLFAVRNILRIS